MNIKLEKYSYDIAFILPPWKEIYKTDTGELVSEKSVSIPFKASVMRSLILDLISEAVDFVKLTTSI